MSTAHKLPLRGSRDAPHFDGTPTHLQRYFADIEQLHKFYGIPYIDEDLIVRAIYYLDAETAELWEGRLTQGMQWGVFKAAVGGLYPGWDGERLYTIRDLENVVRNYAEQGIFNRITLGQYYRDFEKISKYLAKHGWVNDHERDRLFIQGFGETTSKRIEARIAITNQQHHPDDPYPMVEVQKAAEWLLASTTATGSQTSTVNTPGAIITVSGTTGMTPEPAMKQESELLTYLKTLNTSLLVLTQQLKGGNASKQPNTPNTSNSNKFTCHFCGKEGCRIKDCGTVDDYIQSGKAIRNLDGRISLPSGAYIPRNYTGKTLAEKFDQYHLNNPGQTAATGIPTVSTTMFEPVDTLAFMEDNPGRVEIESDDEEEELEEIYTAEASKRLDKGKKKSTNQAVPPEVVIPKPKIPVPVTLPKADKVPGRPDPQFQFHSPCENSELASKVWDCVLDAPVTITQRELLAVSGDMRKKYKEFTSAKRVPVHYSRIAESMFNQEASNRIVAPDSEPLRAIKGILDGKLEAELVVDNGSSIVAMKTEVWARSGIPMRPDSLMNMESSHGTVQVTRGVLKDAPVQIGPLTFYLQIQVTDHLPCDVLLGKPFFTYRERKTKKPGF